MANELQSPPEPSMTSLLSGIIDDVQVLIKQQGELIRSEIKHDFQKTRIAVSSIGVGVGIAGLGVILLGVMVAYLLHWRTAPAGHDPAGIPLWGCFGIVGGALSLLGGALIFAGKKKFDSFNPLPDESFQALKENLQWQTNNPR